MLFSVRERTRKLVPKCIGAKNSPIFGQLLLSDIVCLVAGLWLSLLAFCVDP